MPYLGNDPGAITDAFTDTFSGNGSNTGFTLTRASTTNSVFVRIHGVMQRNGTDFTVDGTTLTFTTAPPNASNNIVVQFFTVGSVQEVADNAITLAKMAGGTDGNLITFDASGDPAYVATGNDGQVLTSTGAGSAPAFEALPASGKVAQIVSTLVEAAATGTTSIPYDDTIPQNNEGNEYMTLAITPTNSSSVLRIDVKITSSNSTAGQNTGVALFQDSTAGALASALQLTMGDTELQEHSINHTMTAGTTSETTFKVRAGRHSAGTFYFNSKGGTSYHGGVLFSSIIITEYLP